MTVDSIPPVAAGPLAITPTGRAPVERPERITRERDGRAKERQERRRRQLAQAGQPGQSLSDEDDRPHIDIRV
ncbi:MAG TPA: hypothetical protein VIJ33_06050 [Solirubrobacteraceae bacterium]